MKLTSIFFETVIRREVHAAAEPPYRLLTFPARDKKTHVHMHRRHKRIQRMHDQRYPHHLERSAGQVWSRGGCRPWQLATEDVGEVDATAFKELAFFDQATNSAAAFGPIPGVTKEGFSIQLGKNCDYSLL